MGGSRRWNDDTISDDDVVYRYVPAWDRTFVETDEDELEPSRLAPKAFVRADFPDGWSVYRRDLMVVHNLTIRDIEESADDPVTKPREVWQASVGAIREVGMGVVDAPDPQLGKIGEAHGVLRFPEEMPTKTRVRETRAILIPAFSRAS